MGNYWDGDHEVPYDGPAAEQMLIAARALCPLVIDGVRRPCQECVEKIIEGVARGQGRWLDDDLKRAIPAVDATGRTVGALAYGDRFDGDRWTRAEGCTCESLPHTLACALVIDAVGPDGKPIVPDLDTGAALREVISRTIRLLHYVADHGGGEPGPLPGCPDPCPSCQARRLALEWTALS